MNFNYNHLLDRELIRKWCTDWLENYDNLKMNEKKALFICGENGVGKSVFVNRLLTELNYDVIKFDSGDSRGPQMVEQISHNNIAKESIMSWVAQKKKKVAIVINEIDVINSVDKTNTITALIKLIRPKKTKRQENELYSLNPVICIGNVNNDRTIDELLNVCHVIELKRPTHDQIYSIIRLEKPFLSTQIDDAFSFSSLLSSQAQKEKNWKMISSFLRGNLTRLAMLYVLYENMDNAGIITKEKEKKNINVGEQLLNDIQYIYTSSAFVDDSKMKTEFLLNNKINMQQHQHFISENERNIINLLWHENICDHLSGSPHVEEVIKFGTYVDILDNICFSDYFDRLVLQKQIYQFNEMTSFIKTCKNNNIYHSVFSSLSSSSTTKKNVSQLFSFSSSFVNEHQDYQPSFQNDDCQQKENEKENSNYVNLLPLTKEKKKKKQISNILNSSSSSTSLQFYSSSSSLLSAFNISNIPGKKIRFTKILTKYATEFNNFLFIQNICGLMNVDKKDAIGILLSKLQSSCCEWKSLNLFSQINESQMKHKSDYVDIHPLVVFFQQFDISFAIISRFLKYISHGQLISRCKETTTFEKQSSRWMWIQTKSSENLELIKPLYYPCLEFTSFLSIPGLKVWIHDDLGPSAKSMPIILSAKSVETTIGNNGPNSRKKRKTKNIICSTSTDQISKIQKPNKSFNKEKKIKLDNHSLKDVTKEKEKEKENQNQKHDEQIKIYQHFDSLSLLSYETKNKDLFQNEKQLPTYIIKEENEENICFHLFDTIENDVRQPFDFNEDTDDENQTIIDFVYNNKTNQNIQQQWKDLGFNYFSVSSLLSDSTISECHENLCSNILVPMSPVSVQNKTKSTTRKHKSKSCILDEKEKEKEKQNLILLKQQTNFRNFLTTNKKIN